MPKVAQSTDWNHDSRYVLDAGPQILLLVNQKGMKRLGGGITGAQERGELEGALVIPWSC